MSLHTLILECFFRFGLSKNQGKFALPTFSTEDTNLALIRADEESDCGNVVIDTNPAVNCGNSLTPYRSQDGSCNNIRHPNWGRANIALTRLLPPEYEDGKGPFIYYVSTKGRGGE